MLDHPLRRDGWLELGAGVWIRIALTTPQFAAARAGGGKITIARGLLFGARTSWPRISGIRK
jgi:hypothetical protein